MVFPGRSGSYGWWTTFQSHGLCLTFCCTECLTEVQPNDNILYFFCLFFCGIKTVLRLLTSIETCAGRCCDEMYIILQKYFLIYFILKCIIIKHKC